MWNDHPQCQERPGPAQSTSDSQGRRALRVGNGTFDQDHGVALIRRQSVLTQEAAANFGLQCCEAEMVLAIAVDDETDGAIAEIAGTVEQDDGVRRSRLRDPLSCSWQSSEGTFYHIYGSQPDG